LNPAEPCETPRPIADRRVAGADFCAGAVRKSHHRSALSHPDAPQRCILGRV